MEGCVEAGGRNPTVRPELELAAKRGCVFGGSSTMLTKFRGKSWRVAMDVRSQSRPEYGRRGPIIPRNRRDDDTRQQGDRNNYP